MDSSVMQCIKVRTDFFENYYDVPAEAKADVDAFVADITALGESSADAQAFEASFASGGYQERFNALLVRCTPKAYQMTAEDKAYSKEVSKQMREESGSSIAKDIANDVLDYARVMGEEELIAQRRKAMIKDGTYDEYTRASNVADIVEESVGFFGKLFKKKK